MAKNECILPQNINREHWSVQCVAETSFSPQTYRIVTHIRAIRLDRIRWQNSTCTDVGHCRIRAHLTAIKKICNTEEWNWNRNFWTLLSFFLSLYYCVQVCLRINKRKRGSLVHLQNEFESYGKFANHNTSARWEHFQFVQPKYDYIRQQQHPLIVHAVLFALRAWIVFMCIAAKTANQSVEQQTSSTMTMTTTTQTVQVQSNPQKCATILTMAILMMKCILSDDECVVIFIYRNFFRYFSLVRDGSWASGICASVDASLILLLHTGKWKVKMMRINK